MATPDRRNRLKDVEAVQFNEKKPPKNKNLLWFILGAVALVLVAVLAVFGYKYFSAKMQSSDIVYEAHVINTTTANTDEGDVVYAPYKDGIVMASRNEVCFYNTKGETIWALDVGVLNPFLKINGNYILLAGKNTKDYLLIKNGKILLQANSAYNILNAGVASNGAFFLVEDEPYYKGLLTVYDSKNQDKFVWHSGTSYIIDAAFNNRASQIAISTLSATPNLDGSADKEATYSSSLLLFKLHESEPYKTYDFDQQIAASVFFASGRYMLITDNSVCAYSSTDGEEIWNYSYAPHILQRVNFNANKLAILTMTDDGAQALHILKPDGKLLGRIDALKNAGDISLCGNIVAVGSGSSLSVYNTNGVRRYGVTLPKTYNDICLFGNGQYLLGANNIVLDVLSTK